MIYHVDQGENLPWFFELYKLCDDNLVGIFDFLYDGL